VACRTIVSCVCVWLLLAGDAVCAAAADDLTKFALKIDRQPLDGALQQLAKQCGLQVIFFSRVTEGVAAPALEGEYTLSAAMEELLAGSQLTFRVINEQTVEVQPRQARPVERSRSRSRELAETLASGSVSLDEVVVVGLAEQLVATRIATPLHEIPQTISIVTREQIRQQNSLDLGDVMTRVTGVSTTRVSSLEQEYFARGYQITSIHVDGGAALDPTFAGLAPVALVQADLSEFDHVEVMRGSDALFTGNGNPGGTLSLIRKQPQRSFALDANATLGSWDKRRIEVDVTGPIAFDGALRARADVVHGNTNYFYDAASAERTKFFAAVAWDITPDATLIAGGSHQSDDLVPFSGGLPRNEDGSDPRLPRDTSFVFDWQQQRNRTTEGYLQYRQTSGGALSFRANAAGWRTTTEFAEGRFLGDIDSETQGLGTPEFTFTDSPTVLEQVTADATLTGVFDWFGRRQELAIGGDFTRVKSAISTITFDSSTPLANVHDFDPSLYPDPRSTLVPWAEISGSNTIDQYGAFVSARVYLNDAWSVTAGARTAGFAFNSHFEVSFFGMGYAGGVHHSDSQIVTPYAGVVYSPGEHYSLYASYADIYGNPGFLASPDGQQLEMRHGVTVEAGIKGRWRGGALTGSMAIYSVDQNNSLMYVVRGNPGVDPAGLCCFAGETSRSQGVDVELSGEVRPGWRLGVGYTFNDTERPGGIQYSDVTPKHLFKAWTSFRLPDGLNRWTVGGNLHAQSRTQVSLQGREGGVASRTVEGEQPSYAVLDLRVGFEIDSNWQVAVTANNALDKIYYESRGLASFRNWYGEPRNVTLRIDGRF
jgi:TonB-dependent siderophore receptor